jgi:hypothetical protein
MSVAALNAGYRCQRESLASNLSHRIFVLPDKEKEAICECPILGSAKRTLRGRGESVEPLYNSRLYFFGEWHRQASKVSN